MGKRVEVKILDQPFTFIGEDEEKIRMVAEHVDDRLSHVKNEYGIINTINCLIMAMMELMHDYLEIKGRAEMFEGRTLRLIEKVEKI
jgi:cell division protein ZapA (FtsZ GTPase activity inhibitor)